ncbi:MAG: PIN-like domain-containing protein [Caldilineaceae bacterium]
MAKFVKCITRSSATELEELWNNCVFVFDTNVLLDLHRYSSRTSSEFLDVLEKISKRVWLPHQVGLEYQENRLTVIAEQKQRYDKAIKVLDDTVSALEEGLSQLNLKKSHSPVDPRSTIKKVKSVLGEFRVKLEEIREYQPNVSDEDVIRSRLDIIFNDKVGVPPSSQQELDQIYIEGKQRQEKKIPPGYMDQGKGKSSHESEKKKESFFYNGLLYRKEFGDLIIWSQIIQEFLSRKDSKQIIFVTSDNKEDWWWKFDGKVIGPRYELVQEILLKTPVTLFYMYNAEQFLLHARNYLSAKISQDSIDQVRDIAQQKLSNKHLLAFAKFHQVVEHLYNHLKNVNSSDEVVYNENKFPDIIHINKATGQRMGYEVKMIADTRHAAHILKDITNHAYEELYNKTIDAITILVVNENLEKLQHIQKIEEVRIKPTLPEQIFIKYSIAQFNDGNHLVEFQML